MLSACARLRSLPGFGLLFGPGVTGLLAKESLHRKIEDILTPPADLANKILSDPTEQLEITEGAKKNEVENLHGETERIEETLQGVSEQLEILRQNIEKGRAEIAARKESYKQRRTEVQNEGKNLNERKPQLLDPLQKDIKRLDHKLKRNQEKTVTGRVKLCRETARLAGLSQRRRRARDGSIKEDYTIGNIGILDLRDLNAARPDQVTASLANLSRLLTTCCHYLSIRLPAEITPAHADYPHPTIFSLQSSYQNSEVPFPSSAPGQSTIHSPSASRLLGSGTTPKPRLLHLDRPVPRLAKEDQHSYNLFIEGVTLLAWDVAWLCRSQGVLSINTWEDVCQIGRNLWALFVETPIAHASSAASSQRNTPAPAEPSSQAPPPTATLLQSAAPVFGELSHASIGPLNLAGPVATDLLRNWRLASPARLIDKIKSHLLTEMSGAEWELLDEKEWNEEREDEQAVLVGGPRRKEMVGEMSVMTAVGEGEGKRESSGWMKVRGRGNE
ncbi:hypothetical protein M8818_000795 [Zalaria obscura]|uniref:Uncharacterized protein n=1 Tax=Zalaria obscura TaxID=2024903 RepID=A0ACC3SMT8_9PEZI